MTETLVDILTPEPSKLDLSSPQASEYLSYITSLDLDSLLSEPTNLSSTSSHLTNALTNLCTSSYSTFLSLHATTGDLTTTLSSFSSTLDGLLEDIPILETSARSLSAEINGVQSERRRAALVLEHSAKLQDVLELPLLAESCVRNGYFQEALDLAAHAAALAARFPTVHVVQDVRAEVDSAVRTLLTQLLGMLRSPAKLPLLFKAVSFLRRMQVLPEEELALAFLTGRLETIDLALSAVDLEKKGVEADREREAWVRYMKKYIDVWREGVHDVVTQYTTIFLDRPSTSTSPSGTPSTLSALLPTFTTHLLSRLLDALREALPHIPDPTALTSLLTQLTYCATSFARVGLDFRLLLPPLFADAVRRGVTAEFVSATSAWERALDTKKPPTTWLVVASAVHSPPLPQENTLAGAAYTPPAFLASYPPIANYLNALLTTLNSLRLLAPVSLLPELVQALDAALADAARAFVKRPEESKEDELILVKAAGTVFVKVLVPFVRRALVEGVYGFPVGEGPGTSDTLEAVIGELEGKVSLESNGERTH
ncbi:Dor1-domain-containing protein [Amylostereum chailletii]|nr:Dor1-domain-containing protein [Amylostereum chailletii]